MESLIITADVACAVYLCWCLVRGKSKQPEASDLGIFAYKDDVKSSGGKR